MRKKTSGEVNSDPEKLAFLVAFKVRESEATELERLTKLGDFEQQSDVARACFRQGLRLLKTKYRGALK